VNVHVELPSLAEVRVFVDEDLAGFGLAMMQQRDEVVVGCHDPVAELAVHRGPAWLALRGDRHRHLEYKPGEPPRLPPRHRPAPQAETQ
jgi:hypothetical protein